MPVKEKFLFRIIPAFLSLFLISICFFAAYSFFSVNNLLPTSASTSEHHDLIKLLAEPTPYEGIKKARSLKADGEVFPEIIEDLIAYSSDRLYSAETQRISALIRDFDFESAEHSLLLLEELFPDDPRVRNLRFSVTDPVLYEGVVEHIFFHPLIVYPERAFPANGRQTGQDLYMVTVYEFKRIISQLHKNGYVLVNIEDLFDVSYNESGGVTGVKRRPLYLPRGKKPLVLSVDDINYYEYMIKDGQNFKLILDDAGELCTYSKDMSGNTVISYDNEIMTIVDAFVDEHPDFSMNFAKGALGVTGYEGVLGWRINDRPEKVPNYESEAYGLKQVVAKLKENGWTFASHSQGHRNTSTASIETITEDTDRWDAIVKPFVGATPVYIYPYGAGVKETDPKFIDFQNHGFGIFCTVQMAPLLKLQTSSAVMSRKNIDGIAFNGRALDHMMDVDAVIDPLRPNVKRKPK